jgi:hypothetical protein
VITNLIFFFVNDFVVFTGDRSLISTIEASVKAAAVMVLAEIADFERIMTLGAVCS